VRTRSSLIIITESGDAGHASLLAAAYSGAAEPAGQAALYAIMLISMHIILFLYVLMTREAAYRDVNI